MPKTEDFKIPKSLAAAADQYYETRQARLALERQVAALQGQERLLKDHLINNLPKDDATGVQGQVCRVSVVVKAEPAVEDWDAFYKYISRTKSWELLQRRVSAPAVRERWEHNKKIPGVGVFNNVTLSVNKV